MSKAEDIFKEVLSIVEAHRIGTATTSESLVARADALSELALGDLEAGRYAMITMALTSLYAKMEEQVERACMNHEYAEALFAELENNIDKENIG